MGKNRKTNKGEKFYVTLDLTDDSLTVAESIAKNREQLEECLEGLDSVLTELIEKLAEESKNVPRGKKDNKLTKWYKKLITAVKSLFRK
jgi:predicted RNase H-like HicB family nuclease